MEGKGFGIGRSVLPRIMGKNELADRSWEESKKMWHIAGPAILTEVTQFSIGFVTVAFVGHLGEVELAAISIVQNVIEIFVYGIMLGMGSALETLCGQAVGAAQLSMLGIYLQRSWLITISTALALTPIYVFAAPILKLLHQSSDIAELAGRFSFWVIPQLFAYALNFPLQKFFQSQSRVWVLTVISLAALAFHVLFNWLFVIKLGHGLLGAAIAANISWWLIVLAQLIYMVSGYFPEAWRGFSFLAFKALPSFVKLSLASAVMFCLELWYYTAVILMMGGFKNAAIAIDSISICMNLQMWTVTVAMGFNAAVSVRVSNELGAGHPKKAKFSTVVASVTSLLFGIVFAVAVVAAKHDFPKMFTSKPVVLTEASKLVYLLAVTILLNSIQSVLHGIAVGAGWQFAVAIINIGCYYVFGLPVVGLLGFKFKLGVQGIWSGMLLGSLLQVIILLFIVLRTDWNKEASQAEDRLRTWGGPSAPEDQHTNDQHTNETQDGL